MWIAVFASLLCLHASGQAPQWQDLHKVKRGETLFGIAKEYNVTIQQIIDANPEMKKEGYELQKGAWIVVPFGKKETSAAARLPRKLLHKLPRGRSLHRDRYRPSVQRLPPRRRRMARSAWA